MGCKAWLIMGQERLGMLEPLGRSSFVRAAEQMNLGTAEVGRTQSSL